MPSHRSLLVLLEMKLRVALQCFYVVWREL
jgi:hypothetical protein